MDPRLVAFVGVAALLTISPGPDMALMLRNVLRSGRAVVVPTAVGTCTGVVVWGAASSLGIAAVVAASGELYDGLRLAGAAYLVLLGLVELRHALRGRDGTAAGDRPGSTGDGALAPRAAFRQALLTNLLNPKVGVFYATFLPQFIPPGAPVLLTSVALATAHAGMGLAWLVTYGLGAARIGDTLRRGRVRRAIEGVTGSVLVAFGARIAAEVRRA